MTVTAVAVRTNDDVIIWGCFLGVFVVVTGLASDDVSVWGWETVTAVRSG